LPLRLQGGADREDGAGAGDHAAGGGHRGRGRAHHRRDAACHAGPGGVHPPGAADRAAASRGRAAAGAGGAARAATRARLRPYSGKTARQPGSPISMRSTRTSARARHAVFSKVARAAFLPEFVVSASGSNSEVSTSAAAPSVAAALTGAAFFLGL